MKATIRTTLPNAAEMVWEALLRRDTFLAITRGVLGFEGSDTWPERFYQGLSIETRLLLFHVIPGWIHTIKIERADAAALTIESREGGGFVQKWNHKISVDPVSETSCMYADEIEIEAGLGTLWIWLFAQFFYRYRQARWHQVAKALNNDAH